MHEIFDYLTDGALTILVSTPIYILIRFLIIKYTKAPIVRRREILLGLFWLFAVWLASETILPEFSFITDSATGKTVLQSFPLLHIPARERLETGVMMNLVPFDTIQRYTSFRSFGSSAVNLVGNVVMFIPLGALPPVLWKRFRALWKMTLLGFFTSCAIECIQLFIDRSVDIDDVLLNTLGVMLGYILIRLIFHFSPRAKRSGLKK